MRIVHSCCSLVHSLTRSHCYSHPTPHPPTHPQTECERLRTVIAPFASTMREVADGGAFPVEMVGANRPVWASICEQLNALVQNVINEKQRAAALIEDYRENQNKRSEASERHLLQSQTIMSLVLSIFSPLAFISG